MALCFWMSDVIFTPRQASFQMISCLEDTQFLWDEYFAFSRYPMKKQIVPTDAAHFLGQKQQKSQKINLYKKYATAMISQTVHRQESSKVAVKHCHMPIWASHSTFCSKFTETVKMMACVIWLPPLEAIQRPVNSMCDCFHFLPHTGDLIYCNVFVDGGHTVLNSETPPWLVFGDWTISVH